MNAKKYIAVIRNCQGKEETFFPRTWDDIEATVKNLRQFEALTEIRVLCTFETEEETEAKVIDCHIKGLKFHTLGRRQMMVYYVRGRGL